MKNEYHPVPALSREGMGVSVVLFMDGLMMIFQNSCYRRESARKVEPIRASSVLAPRAMEKRPFGGEQAVFICLAGAVCKRASLWRLPDLLTPGHFADNLACDSPIGKKDSIDHKKKGD